MSASLVSKNNQNDGCVLDDLGLPELRPSYIESAASLSIWGAEYKPENHCTERDEIVRLPIWWSDPAPRRIGSKGASRTCWTQMLTRALDHRSWTQWSSQMSMFKLFMDVIPNWNHSLNLDLPWRWRSARPRPNISGVIGGFIGMSNSWISSVLIHDRDNWWTA